MKRSATVWLGPILAMMFAATAAWGGEDVAGAKDHPLLTRYPDSFITEYTRNYNATEFQVGARGTRPKVETVEGDTATLRYFYESPTSTSIRARRS
jgi:OmpA-OmpF porin, OOP family